MGAILGSGAYRYERVEGWAKIPPYFSLAGLGPLTMGGVVDVACDAHDCVYALCRGNHPVMIFAPDGSFVSSWGEGHFRWPHGIHIDAADNVYVTDAQKHTVEQFSLGGELRMTLGTPGWAAVTMRGEPFNMPTGTVVAPDGSLFVSDGYGNRRVHHFTADGRLLKSWGAPGNGPGEFILPHFLDVDAQGTVYVCDRENDRVQLFTVEGAFVGQWTELHRPADVHVDRAREILYLGEQGGPRGMPRLSVRDLQGRVLSAWEGFEGLGQGVLHGPHGIGVDARGNLYEAGIGEMPGIQKFARVG
jgi:DNA-binding beta-propeller fold protein YncE